MTRPQLTLLSLSCVAAVVLAGWFRADRNAATASVASVAPSLVESGVGRQELLQSSPTQPQWRARREAVAAVADPPGEVTRASALEDPEANDEAAPARALRVLVVDAEGEPVPDVPVHVVSESPIMPGRYSDRFYANSAANGVAVLPETDSTLDLRFHTEESTGYRIRRLGVRCGYSPGDPDDELDDDWIVWLDQEPAPGELLRVRCPDLGWVRVSVEGPGAPDVSARFPVRAAWERRVYAWQRGARGRKNLEQAPASALLGPFPLGWQLTLRVGLHDRAGDLDRLNVDGPVRAGEIVEVTFELPPSRWFTGVALHADRTPIAEERLWFRLGDPDSGDPPGGGARTDANGRWRLPVPVDIEIEELVLQRFGGQPRPQASVVIPAATAFEEELDVGAVVIHSRADPEPPPKPEIVLVAGRVVDENGDAIDQARVLAYRVAKVDPSTGRSLDTPQLAATRTNRLGEYELVAEARFLPERIQLHPVHGAFLSAERTEVAVGDKAVDLVLVRGATIGCEVVLDDAIHPLEVEVRLTGSKRDRSPDLAFFLWRQAGVFEGHQAGLFVVTFAIKNTQWTLHESRVEVFAGEHVEFGPVNLSGKVRVLQLRLTDAAGEPIWYGRFELLDGDGVGHRSLGVRGKGRIVALVPRDTAAFQFGNNEYGMQTIVASDDPIVLVLER